MSKRVGVAGAGGMIGGYLVKRLSEEGYQVVAADIRPANEWLQITPGVKSISSCDLSIPNNAEQFLNNDLDEMYLLAANMGGIGWIEHQPWECISSVDITMQCLKAAAKFGGPKVFYSSSACAYPIDIQTQTIALKESDAWKGRAEYGYGEEKLFSESLCGFAPFETRVARYHNVYAPANTTFEGGREKAPAAICRKVAEAILNGTYEIQIWGDGEQTRSFMHIDDCIEGSIRIMESDYAHPLNLGSEELVSINELVSIVEDIAGVELDRKYDLSAPQGVRGRNSDNTLIRSTLGWEPSIKLAQGLEGLYAWIYNQIKHRY